MIENLQKFGIGIDITNIKKFKKLTFVENKIFYKKLFTESEIKYCLKFKYPSSHFAGKFAVKEATKKSLNDNIPMKNIKTSHSNSKPIITITKLKNYSFLVSLSHENDLAIAVVVSFKLD
jgi:holo-[acyl-carrier protein] synthase